MIISRKCYIFWQLTGIVFTVALGVLLHFTYDWSGQNYYISLFSAVNESTWEHLKLIFFPMLIFMLIEYVFYGSAQDNFIPARVYGILSGMLSIVVLYYTISGILGTDYAWLNIAIFVAGVIIAFCVSHKIFHSKKLTSGRANLLAIIILLVVAACFIVFTNNPPNIGLFKSPV